MKNKNLDPEEKTKAEAMLIRDASHEPRSMSDIHDAIALMNEILVHVLVRPLEYPPRVVVFAPTIRDCLKELIERREHSSS